MKVKSESEVAQSCPTLSDPMDCSLPGSYVHGIFQARVLEWGAIAFSGRKLSPAQIEVTRPWLFNFVDKEFTLRQKVEKQGMCLLGGKSTVYVGKLRETVTKYHPCGRLNHLHGAFLLGFFCSVF